MSLPTDLHPNWRILHRNHLRQLRAFNIHHKDRSVYRRAVLEMWRARQRYNQARKNMDTIIRANGSKWAGQEPDPIEVLLEILREGAPLAPEMCNISFTNDMTRFRGNFRDRSHVFDIETRDIRTVLALWQAFARLLP